MSPHLRSHYRQDILSQQTPTPRSSQRPTKRTWKSKHFHDENFFTEALLPQIPDPSSVKEALESPDTPHWQTAMDKEYKSLVDNHTWELTDLPPNKSVISSKWIFRRKYHSNRTLSHFKARFVARGYSQEPGIDYFDTYSPVIKIASLRLLLAFATIHDYHIHQIDVITAFLNANLTKELYSTQRDGYIQPGSENKVYPLLKSLYGLKQAFRAWYQLFDNFLLSQSFTKCGVDPNVYFKRSHNSILLLGLYIDDLILISDNLEFLTITKSLFAQRFSMTDDNDIVYILGIQI